MQWNKRDFVTALRELGTRVCTIWTDGEMTYKVLHIAGVKMMTKFISNETTYMVHATKTSSTKYYVKPYCNQPVLSSADMSFPAL